MSEAKCRINVQRFRGGLVSKAHRRVYHSRLESNEEEECGSTKWHFLNTLSLLPLGTHAAPYILHPTPYTLRRLPRQPPSRKCATLSAGPGSSHTEEQLLYRNVKRFRGGLVSKAHRLLYHSTLDQSSQRLLHNSTRDEEEEGYRGSRHRGDVRRRVTDRVRLLGVWMLWFTAAATVADLHYGGCRISAMAASRPRHKAASCFDSDWCWRRRDKNIQRLLFVKNMRRLLLVQNRSRHSTIM